MESRVLTAAAHMTVVMLLALSGNLLLLFVIFRGNSAVRRRISPVQMLLLHTCMADLMFATITLGTEILILLSYPAFHGPAFVCKLVRYLQAVPLYASPFLLVAISVDRYQAICRPLVHYRSDRYRRPNCLGGVAWLLAAVCALPQVFVWVGGNGRCVTVYGSSYTTLKSVYVLSFSTLAWLLPSALSALFYFQVGFTVWRSKSKLEQCSGRLDVQRPCLAQPTTQVYVDRLRDLGFKKQRSEFDRQRLQTVRLTLTIVVCNFFLWAPFCVANFVQAFAPNLLDAQMTTLFAICGNLNSCVNPWIYIVYNSRALQRAFNVGKNASAQISNRTWTNTSTVLPEGHAVRRASSECLARFVGKNFARHSLTTIPISKCSHV